MTPRQAGALTSDPQALHAFKDIATLRDIEVPRPPDAPTDGEAAAALPGERGMNRLAERLEKLAELADRPTPPRFAPSCAPRCPASCSSCSRSSCSRARQPRSPPIRLPPCRSPRVGSTRPTLRIGASSRTGRAGAWARRGSRRPSRTSSTRARSSACSRARSAGTASASRGRRPREGTGWWLRFEQVRRKARVWLNGVEIGSSTQPYTPFQLPARGLKVGQPNILVVRADNRRAAGTREGWWNWGGITRPVSLVPRGPVVLHDAGVMPRRTCDADGENCRWDAIVDGWLENRSAALAAARGAPDAARARRPASVGSARPRTLRPGERVRVRFTVPVKGEPKLWEPDDPNLYDATVRTLIGARVDPGRPAARSACARSRSSTARCASTTRCSTCAARRSRRTRPAAAPR